MYLKFTTAGFFYLYRVLLNKTTFYLRWNVTYTYWYNHWPSMNWVSARSFSAESSVASPAPWLSHWFMVSRRPVGRRLKEKHQSFTWTNPSRQPADAESGNRANKFRTYRYRSWNQSKLINTESENRRNKYWVLIKNI